MRVNLFGVRRRRDRRMAGVDFNIVRIETKSISTGTGDITGKRGRNIMSELQLGPRTIGGVFGVLLYKSYYLLVLERKLVGRCDLYTNHVINSL